MAEQTMVPDVEFGYTPTEDDRRSLAEWFERYDALSEQPDVEAMADMGVFPMNLVTDGADGEAYTAQWDRATYLATMGTVMGGGGEAAADAGSEAGGAGGEAGAGANGGDSAAEMGFDSVRTPFFLSGSLAVVFTAATMTYGGQTRQMHYADVLVRNGGNWRFQTMVQGGWAELMRGDLPQ